MELNLQVNTKQWDFLTGETKRINHLYGGKCSGKSYSIGQHLLINKFYREKDIRILVTRKTLPALKKSAMQLILDLLDKYNLPYSENKSDHVLTYGKNMLFFLSLDDPQKIQSVESNYVWGNEAMELTSADRRMLNLQCRRDNINGINQLFYDYNPTDEMSQLKTITDQPPENTAVKQFTFLDNKFANEIDIKELKSLQNQDETYYKMFALGEWSTPVNLIYKFGLNWYIVDTFPDKFDYTIYGLDFGFNNQTALVELNVKDKINVYERALIYQTHLDTNMLIERMKEVIPEEHRRRREIYADPEAPGEIEAIFKAGFNIKPAKKGQGSVKASILHTKRYKIYHLVSSTETIDETKAYKWKQDKNDNVLDEPVDYMNHAKDAERYGLYTHEKKEIHVGVM